MTEAEAEGRRKEEGIIFEVKLPADNKYDGLGWETCGPNTIFTDKNNKIRLIEYWNGVDEYYNENEQLYHTTGEPDVINEVQKFKEVNTLISYIEDTGTKGTIFTTDVKTGYTTFYDNEGNIDYVEQPDGTTAYYDKDGNVLRTEEKKGKGGK
jgi:hypothetical protein